MKHVFLLIIALFLCASVRAQESGAATEAKTLSGMSVLGNNEAPKALVIVGVCLIQSERFRRMWRRRIRQHVGRGGTTT